MKKLLALLLVLVLVFAFAACSTSGPCDLCGTTANLKTVSHEGETAHLCESCYALYQLGLSLQN